MAGEGQGEGLRQSPCGHHSQDPLVSGTYVGMPQAGGSGDGPLHSFLPAPRETRRGRKC